MEGGYEMWGGSNRIYKNPGLLLLGAQAGPGYNAAQLGTFTVGFADSLSPALERCDVCVDLGLASPLLVLSFAPAPSGGRTPLLRCSNILHPLQWGCTKCFTISPTQNPKRDWRLGRSRAPICTGMSYWVWDHYQAEKSGVQPALFLPSPRGILVTCHPPWSYTF